MGDPVVVKVNLQSISIIPRPEKVVLPEEAEAIKVAVRESQTAVTSAMQLTSLVLDALGPKEFGKVDADNWLVRDRTTIAAFYDIVFGCFRIPEPRDRHGFEDYRRLMRRVQAMLRQVADGLATEGLAVSDLAPQFYKANESAQGESGKVAGYIQPTTYQFLQMKFGSDFRNFWEEGHLAGPIHLNFGQLVDKPWQLKQTLIHEATHKFGRTWDHAYYYEQLGKEAPTELFKVRTAAKAMAKLQNKNPAETLVMIEDALEKALAMAPDVKKMSAIEALNNADSHANFVMWLLS